MVLLYFKVPYFGHCIRNCITDCVNNKQYHVVIKNCYHPPPHNYQIEI